MAEQNENFAPRQEPHIQDDNVYPPKDTHEELKSQAEEEAKIAFDFLIGVLWNRFQPL